MNDYCDESRERVFGLLNLATEVTRGDDVSHLESDFWAVVDVEDVKRIFQRDGVLWGPLVEADVAAILAGRPPQYFMGMWEWAQVYRARRNIPTPNLSGGLWGGPDEGFLAELERDWQECEKYGVPARLFADHACYKELQYFYRTPEWRNRAKAARFVGQHRCRICGATNVELHVHHLAPIISAYHYPFALNFADWKLRVLCRDCHKRAHAHAIRVPGCFIMVTPEGFEKYRSTLRKVEKLHHDILCDCSFCQNRIAERYPNTPS